MLFIAVVIIHILSCILLIVAVLLQSGKDAGLSGAFGLGGGQTIFGARAGDVLSKITVVLAVAFMSSCLLFTRVRPGVGRSLMDTIQAEEKKAASQQSVEKPPPPPPQGGAIPAAGPVQQGGAIPAAGPAQQGGSVPAAGPAKQGGAVPAAGPVQQGGAVPAAGPVQQGGAIPAAGPARQGVRASAPGGGAPK